MWVFLILHILILYASEKWCSLLSAYGGGNVLVCTNDIIVFLYEFPGKKSFLGKDEDSYTQRTKAPRHTI